MNTQRVILVASLTLLVAELATGAVIQTLRPLPVPHDVAGRDNCLMCHGTGAMEAVADAPASHLDWASETCLWCHAVDSPLLTIDPPTIVHDVAGRDDCLMCHGVGAMEPVSDVPDSHEGRAIVHCRMCHNP